jgi:transposase
MLNQIFLSAAQRPVIISLDVHDKNTYIYAVSLQSGEIIIDKNIFGNFKRIQRHLERAGIHPQDAMIIYEAGNSGYAPYRYFIRHHYDCRIIAPVSIPQNAKRRRKKTDRDDAINNWKYYTAGILRFVQVPTVEDEGMRDFMRNRIVQVGKVRKEKQKIIALTKRHGLEYTETKKNWTKKHRQWLTRVEMPSSIRLLLDMWLEQLRLAEQHLVQIEQRLDEIIASNPRYSYQMQWYQLMPGFGRVNAMLMLFEIRDVGRFGHPYAIMKYTGLIPGKRSSGDYDPVQHITKQGNQYVRYALVGASKAYGHERPLYTEKQLARFDEPVRDFLTKLQNRLYHRYRMLRANKKGANQARCAIARELCGFVWELMTKVVPLSNSEPSYRKAA